VQAIRRHTRNATPRQGYSVRISPVRDSGGVKIVEFYFSKGLSIGEFRRIVFNSEGTRIVGLFRRADSLESINTFNR